MHGCCIHHEVGALFYAPNSTMNDLAAQTKNWIQLAIRTHARQAQTIKLLRQRGNLTTRTRAYAET